MSRIQQGDCHAFGSQYPRLCNVLPCFVLLGKLIEDELE